ncbi:MCE family protein [Nocardia bovistercoris]|uniref:MCE family protein n=1 Tax=Nocardia bovistercoris TaxID=2785916 RepID=A0A931IA12_9NOCA|nr:MCE family protein [Nocardia bovistercoris]MBH0776638.1 MCE family protein [Nocardia bovistercoris]
MSGIFGRRPRGLAAVALGCVLLTGVSGCEWDGLNSLPMPGTEGTGDGAWQVRIQMPNVTTLTRNSPVRVDDVAVGTVSDIEVEGWHALVTVSLNPGVELPANAVARIGQTSLLGSNHVELAAPTDATAAGRLRDGDLIPLARAGVYPTTEQVLSSLSVVLTGGGITQLEDITRELSAALSGNEDQIRDLLPRLNELLVTLRDQTGSIIAAMNGIDRLGAQIADRRQILADALDELPEALTLLADRRETITTAITALGSLGEVVERIVANGGDNLKANLRSLVPVLRNLGDTGGNLTESMKMLLTFPFPMKNLDHAVKGDYMNLAVNVDLTGKRLDTNFLTGTPLGGRFGGIEGVLGTFAPDTAGQGGNPATGPLQPPGTPSPTVPGLPSIPGLPAIPGLTVPLPGRNPTAPQDGAPR